MFAKRTDRRVAMRRRLLRVGLQLLTLLAASACEPPWVRGAPHVVLQSVLTDLERPVYVTHARDGTNRLFVVEQGGRIKVLPAGATAPTVFLDIASRVLAGGERGLLGLAFHPHYAVNGRFFVNYTRQPDGATVIAEYHASPPGSSAALAGERPLLVISQPFANHNGGMLEFGPDGFLYIGTGDGGAADDPGNRAQDPLNLLGKILRIDVDPPAGGTAAYVSPAGNPFAGPHPGRDEIFAFGFRNPWRFSFDRLTGELHVGDVGQGAREEVDRVTVGGNYGWRILEGTRCTGIDPDRCGEPTLIPPIAEYAHGAGRCSITGGYAYRGDAGTLPAGAYLFGDFCSGEIFMLDNGVQTVLLATDLSIASFGEDEAGEVYVVSLTGTVYRLVNPDAPRLTLSVNQPAPRPGDTIRVRVGLGTGEAAVSAHLYFGVVLPDRLTAIFLTSLSPPAGSVARLTDDARTFPPLIRGALIPAATDVTAEDFLVFALTGAEEPGGYVVFAALVRPGAFDDGRVDPGDLLAFAQGGFTVNR
jgi:glucose/arabinose dehydrogenase